MSKTMDHITDIRILRIRQEIETYKQAIEDALNALAWAELELDDALEEARHEEYM